MLCLAFPDSAGGNEPNIFGAATRAEHAITEATGHEETKAIVWIGEVDYCGLKSLRFGCHAAKVADSAHCVKYIITHVTL